MSPKRRRSTADPFSGRAGTPSRVSKKSERGEGLGDESFSALFDGSTWEIDPSIDLTPVTWVVNDADWIPVDGSARNKTEGPLFNWVLRDLKPSEVAAYSVERGWSLLAVQIQCIGELFGLRVSDGTMICEQRKGKNGSKYLVRCPVDETNL